nr:hypothetical protein Iba_chr14aCG5840 [Ipomoea batatas]
MSLVLCHDLQSLSCLSQNVKYCGSDMGWRETSFCQLVSRSSMINITIWKNHRPPLHKLHYGILIITSCDFAKLRIRAWSKGLQNLASATVTRKPRVSNKAAADKQLCTAVPYPTRATLSPSINIRPLPTSRGVPLLPGGSTTPTPFPLGYRKQLGLSSIAAAVATI